MRVLKRVFACVNVALWTLLADIQPALAAQDIPLAPTLDYVVEDGSGLETVPTTTTPESGTRDVKAFNVTANEYRFAPAVVSVRTGAKIRITLRNTGREPHNLVFHTLPLRTETAKPGDTVTLDMTAPKPGQYPFYCSIDGHASKGMTGVMVVTS